MEAVDVIIIGAGAAGLMCAIEAGKRHRKVLVLDHANKAGKKILMSGGGRCNFTNYFLYPRSVAVYHKNAKMVDYSNNIWIVRMFIYSSSVRSVPIQQK